ncbi:hypothetical protein Nepgr_013920 [Nepenthes gracilis]|uniref:Uncharacterized protein n=1 Tax=Nepenthes gracilis TaxID=150966 RepID=A0AAD3SJW8_NEPGR|nr:hypothetical protein Nepgr_013920 [Nepenthes gracilis]
MRYELLKPSPTVFQMLVVDISIQCFQQITGIDALVYYSPEIFKAAGIEDNAKPLVARKPLLYLSTIGMTVSVCGNWPGLLGFDIQDLPIEAACAITAAGTFFTFSDISALTVIFVYKLVPETKGKSLEQNGSLFGDEAHEGEQELGDTKYLMHSSQSVHKI